MYTWGSVLLLLAALVDLPATPTWIHFICITCHLFAVTTTITFQCVLHTVTGTNASKLYRYVRHQTIKHKQKNKKCSESSSSSSSVEIAGLSLWDFMRVFPSSTSIAATAAAAAAAAEVKVKVKEKAGSSWVAMLQQRRQRVPCISPRYYFFG